MVAKPTAAWRKAASAMPAPSRPPMSAWDELEGMPKYQVSTFQATADASAATTSAIDSLGLGGRLSTWAPMVVATATPKRKGPRNSATAVIVSACRGESARDEIIVATMLELSWK